MTLIPKYLEHVNKAKQAFQVFLSASEVKFNINGFNYFLLGFLTKLEGYSLNSANIFCFTNLCKSNDSEDVKYIKKTYFIHGYFAGSIDKIES